MNCDFSNVSKIKAVTISRCRYCKNPATITAEPGVLLQTYSAQYGIQKVTKFHFTETDFCVSQKPYGLPPFYADTGVQIPYTGVQIPFFADTRCSNTVLRRYRCSNTGLRRYRSSQITGAQIPFLADTGAQIPVFADTGAQIPVFADTGAQIPVFADTGAQIPVFADTGAQIPFFADNAL